MDLSALPCLARPPSPQRRSQLGYLGVYPRPDGVGQREVLNPMRPAAGSCCQARVGEHCKRGFHALADADVGTKVGQGAAECCQPDDRV